MQNEEKLRILNFLIVRYKEEATKYKTYIEARKQTPLTKWASYYSISDLYKQCCINIEALENHRNIIKSIIQCSNRSRSDE